MTIILSSTDGQGYRPTLFNQLKQHPGPMYYVERNNGHPIPLATKSWDAVDAALDRLLDDVVTLEKAFAADVTVSEKDRVVSRSLQSYATFVARISEFVETITENAASAFVEPSGKIKIRNLKEDRRNIDQVNNFMKHNQNFLVSILGITPIGKRIHGFAVYETTAQGLQRPNPIIHKERRIFSFNNAIRETLTAAYIIGNNVGKFVEQSFITNLMPQQDQAISIEEKHRFDLLKRVADLQIDVFPDEGHYTMPHWFFDHDKIEIRRAGGAALPATPDMKIIVPFTPLLGALNFQRP